MTQYVGWLRGCGTALVTPFTGTGAVDEKRFRALVERQIAAGVRVLVPCGTTGEAATLTAAELERLIATTLGLAREVENIVGVKEASGDLGQIMAILRDRPAGFRVLSGDDAVTLPLIALGADGIVSVVSNETPDLMTNLTESALRGDWEI